MLFLYEDIIFLRPSRTFQTSINKTDHDLVRQRLFSLQTWLGKETNRTVQGISAFWQEVVDCKDVDMFIQEVIKVQLSLFER